MSTPRKSSKKSKAPVGFKIYRDQKGRFISKSVWQATPKQKRKSASVVVKRDAKGRFVSEKFLSAKVKIVPEKKKVKVKAKTKLKEKAKPKIKEWKPPRNYFEVLVSADAHPGTGNYAGQHWNVPSAHRWDSNTLAKLAEHAVNKGAKIFRYWYKIPATPGYPTGLMSTPIFSYRNFFKDKKGRDYKRPFQDFFKQIPGPVAYYWFVIS